MLRPQGVTAANPGEALALAEELVWSGGHPVVRLGGRGWK